MGVDFYVCAGCKDTYPDCSSRCVSCDEDLGGCGKSFCGPDCAKLQNWDKEPLPTYKERRDLSQEVLEALWCSCVHCRGELLDSDNLLEYALDLLGLTREQIKSQFLVAAKEKRRQHVETERHRLTPTSDERRGLDDE